MSVVFDANLPASQAQAHALVIGVGEYPHLVGGNLAPAPLSMGLGQLTSSALSAERFANWLMDDLKNPATPLGSVDLLLSPDQFTPTGKAAVSVERATLANIKTAFNRWYPRCHAKKENVAVLFFAGHGLERAIQVLLAEDFGDPASLNIWDHAIDFTSTWYGMGECNASTQCYFIDSCRETPLDLLKTSNLNAYVLKTTQLTQFQDRDAYILKAAAPGKKAYGPQNGVSYFTQALIRCLEGIGAAYWNGHVWKVTTASVTDATIRLMRRTKPAGGQVLTCTRGGESSFTSEIHEFSGDATVLTQITCDPAAALPQATLSVTNGTTVAQKRQPQSAAWDVELSSGKYDVAAAFTSAHFQNTSLSGILMMPPYTPVVVKV